MLAEVTKNPRKGEVTLVLEGLIDNEKIAPKIAQTEESILSELKRHESLILADPRAQSLVAKDWALRLGAPRQLVYRLIASLRGKL
jgi:hypothetical protein